MPGTFSQHLYHVVFSTKGRERWINNQVKDRLYGYMGGILRHENANLVHAGGVEDHVHLLISARPTHQTSELMRRVKGGSSQWVHETFPELAAFTWQEGYASFTVSPSNEPDVVRYLDRQVEHHKLFDFRMELKKLLDLHGVDYEDRFLD